MIILPKIGDKIVKRPDTIRGKATLMIPSLKYKDFWDNFYNRLSEIAKLKPPLDNSSEKIDKYFGCFGSRWHPITFRAKYYHVGIDIVEKLKTKVFIIADGILEYSGFDHINGKYILISHPSITTEDGFSLYSIYMHLQSINIRFTSYQKMLREISLHTYPQIKIKKGTLIGKVGNTGNAFSSHLHLQLEFRKNPLWQINDTGGEIIAIDPLKALGFPLKENLTANIENEKEFWKFYKKNEKDLSYREKFWKKIS